MSRPTSTYSRRCYALAHLAAAGPAMSLPGLADAVTEREHGAVGDHLDERLRIYMSLYHEHVPALAEEGLVSYSQSADEVVLTADPEGVMASLEDDPSAPASPTDGSQDRP